jgi:2,4-dienoyl-CoA reductase-like NADH-dependent reductase (Old Yellow Enzyme family)
MKDSILFQPVTLRSLTLKNRVFMSAAASYDAYENGDIDYTMPIIHFGVARGGCALIPTGGVSGVHISGRTNGSRPMFDCDEHIPSFRKFAESVKQGGAAAFLQLTHGGAGAAPYQLSCGRKPFVPSHYFKNPKAGIDNPENREACPASEDEIGAVIEAFGDAALRARRAGFDGIQVHAAHDSMLAQWLSPLYNRRTDRWGGSVENRSRIHAEILRNMRDKVGEEFPIVMKFGMADSFAGGLTVEDGLAAASQLAEQGNLDVMEVSQGLQDLSDMNKTSMKEKILSPEKEAYYREWTGRLKKSVGDRMFVTMQGGLRSPSLMEEVIQNGEADFVSMCRPYICEPNLVNRWRSGDREKARCISCNQCVFNHILHHTPLECTLGV